MAFAFIAPLARALGLARVALTGLALTPALSTAEISEPSINSSALVRIERIILLALLSLLCFGSTGARAQTGDPFPACVYSYSDGPPGLADVAKPPCTAASWSAVDSVIEADRVHSCKVLGPDSSFCTNTGSALHCFIMGSTEADCYRSYNESTYDDEWAQAHVLCPAGSQLDADPTTPSAGATCTCVAGKVWNEATFSCGCPPHMKWVDAAASCIPVVEIDRTKKPLSCEASPGYGNPIYPLTGTKRESIDLGLHIGGQLLTLTYDSARRAPVAQSGTELADTELPSFGELSRSSLHRRMVIEGQGRGARVSRGDGRIVSFSGNGSGSYTADADVNDRLLSIAGGFRYLDASNRALET